MKKVLLSIIRLYQVLLSPYLSASCRFVPSCSVYTFEAIQKYGARKGGVMGLKRLFRCHPFSGRRGYDPVDKL